MVFYFIFYCMAMHTLYIKDAFMVMGCSLIFQGIGFGVWTYGSHMTAKIFEIDWLPNFPRFGAPLVRLKHAGPPLWLVCSVTKIK